MDAPPDLARTKVEVPPEDEGDPEDGEIRVYWSPSNDLPPMPSVSVVKELRVDPDKEDGLDGWRDRYDGQSQWKRPWWKDQRTFKAYRGTLVHYTILSELGDADGDDYFHTVGEKEWGWEEYYAEYALKKWSKKAPSANTSTVPYTPRENKYDGEHAWDRAVRGMKWAARAFHEELIVDGHLDPTNVVAVEQFVYDSEYGYGGQFDLLYEVPERGEDGHFAGTKTVLADIKTSSAVRFGHKLQSAAYKHAIDTDSALPDVDECAIIRLHPDSETVEVSRSPEWDRTLDGLAHEFLALCDTAHTVAYPHALDAAKVELLHEHEGTTQSELDGVADAEEMSTEEQPEDESSAGAAGD